jgi:acetyl esterase
MESHVIDAGGPGAPAVDPELGALAAHLAAKVLTTPDPTVAPLAEVRNAHQCLGRYLRSLSEPCLVETELLFDGPHGDIPARLYRDAAGASGPLLIYLHGGGFAYGSLDGWDMMLRDLVRESGVSVLSVGYRLAPEHRFPVAADEAAFVLSLVEDGHHALGFVADGIAIGGDSAGANLALGAALGGGHPKLKFLLLLYGVYSCDFNSPSWLLLGTGAFGLSRAQMQWVWSHYLRGPEDRADPRVAPLGGVLSALPRILQIVGTHDPLIDDAKALAAALSAVGIPNQLNFYEGMNHGFMRFPAFLSAARGALTEAAGALSSAIGSA